MKQPGQHVNSAAESAKVYYGKGKEVGLNPQQVSDDLSLLSRREKKINRVIRYVNISLPYQQHDLRLTKPIKLSCDTIEIVEELLTEMSSCH